MMDKELQAFLARHTPFGSWTDTWDGVPLEARVFLSDELPPRAFVGSVRAIVLKAQEVLLVHSSVPILSVGGRCEGEEALEQGLLREVAEETGWRVSPISVIGFIHTWHLDGQRPNWGRPAPDFVDPLFAVEAISFDAMLKKPDEHDCEFIPVAEVKNFSVDELNQTFLREALRKRLAVKSQG